MLSCRCICSAAFFHSAGFEVSYPNLLYHVFACYLTEKPLLASIFKIHIKLFPSGYPLIWFHASLIWILPEAFFQREDLGFLLIFFVFSFAVNVMLYHAKDSFGYSPFLISSKRPWHQHLAAPPKKSMLSSATVCYQKTKRGEPG